jgi:hypothetical protein
MPEAVEPPDETFALNSDMSERLPFTTNPAEQNGCRQWLEGYLSCQQRLALAVA